MARLSEGSDSKTELFFLQHAEWGQYYFYKCETDIIKSCRRLYMINTAFDGLRS